MKVLKVTEHTDGNTTIDYELSELDRQVIRRVLKVKKLTKKIINDFIMRALLHYISKKGGE